MPPLPDPVFLQQGAHDVACHHHAGNGAGQKNGARGMAFADGLCGGNRVDDRELSHTAFLQLLSHFAGKMADRVLLMSAILRHLRPQAIARSRRRDHRYLQLPADFCDGDLRRYIIDGIDDVVGVEISDEVLDSRGDRKWAWPSHHRPDSRGAHVIP